MNQAGSGLIHRSPVTRAELNRRRGGVVCSLPRQDYRSTWALQHRCHAARVEDRCLDTLFLLEHQPVFTVGRRGDPAHWRGQQESITRMGCEVLEIERGGSVTYHGPGQVVGYPILRLRDVCSGPKAYVGMLEEVIIRVLGEWGIEGLRREGLRGVWVAGGGNFHKIAAVGVRITRGVTMHGMALNVEMDLRPFRLITPCGLEDCQVTSMAAMLGTSMDLWSVQERIVYHFGSVFGIEWVEWKKA